MKDSKLSLMVAGLALFIVLGGSAVAASGLINGKKIKPGTITAKQIKNKTITQGKLAPATVESLRGQTGASGSAGQTGATGATGATGTAGANGIVAPQAATGSTVNLPNDVQTEAVHVNLAAGTYMVSARANVISQAASTTNEISCAITVDNVNDFDIVDSVSESPLKLSDTISLTLMAVTPVDQKLTLLCNSDSGIAQVRTSKIIAVRVG